MLLTFRSEKSSGTKAKITGSSRIQLTKIVKPAWKPRVTTRKSVEGLVMDGEVLQVQVITSHSRTTMRTVQCLK